MYAVIVFESSTRRTFIRLRYFSEAGHELQKRGHGEAAAISSGKTVEFAQDQDVVHREEALAARPAKRKNNAKSLGRANG
jgi:hypothetical protein